MCFYLYLYLCCIDKSLKLSSPSMLCDMSAHFCLLKLQEGRDPDYSEYKEFKLTVENLGFRMLMKMGWKEGEGLGSEGQGIKAPVNKYVFMLLKFYVRLTDHTYLKLQGQLND